MDPSGLLIRRLIRVATGQIRHLYNGQCPDSALGSRRRDPDCPACRAIVAVEQHLRERS